MAAKGKSKSISGVVCLPICQWLCFVFCASCQPERDAFLQEEMAAAMAAMRREIDALREENKGMAKVEVVYAVFLAFSALHVLLGCLFGRCWRPRGDLFTCYMTTWQ